MSDKRCTRNKRISNNKAKILLDRQLGVCALCGKSVDIDKPRERNWNVDHIMPKSINKWIEFNTSNDINFEALMDIIDDDNNRIITHYECNYYKGALIVDTKDINNMHLSKEHKQGILKLRHKAEPFIAYYESIKRQVYKRQSCKCFMCEAYYSMNRLNLRRLDANKNRTVENAILICRKCEVSRNFRYKYSK